MDISVRTNPAFVGENQTWLGSRDGIQSPRSITLARSLFTKATHYPAGIVRSGVVLAQVTAEGPLKGMFGPYSDAATDGRQVAKGHLHVSVAMTEGGPNVGGSLQERGFVRTSKLPANHGLDTAARADLKGQFIYRDEV